jgi:hypothetical protein
MIRRRPSATSHIRSVGIKWCPRCSNYRSDDAFGFDLTRDDGLSGWCRACRAEGEKGRREDDRVSVNAATRARYRANPAKWKAKVTVARAIAKGLLSKPTACPRCKRTRNIEAHHHLGYEREHWLDIEWRCRQCHTLEHKRGEEQHTLEHKRGEEQQSAPVTAV